MRADLRHLLIIYCLSFVSSVMVSSSTPLNHLIVLHTNQNIGHLGYLITEHLGLFAMD